MLRITSSRSSRKQVCNSQYSSTIHCSSESVSANRFIFCAIEWEKQKNTIQRETQELNINRHRRTNARLDTFQQFQMYSFYRFLRSYADVPTTAAAATATASLSRMEQPNDSWRRAWRTCDIGVQKRVNTPQDRDHEVVRNGGSRYL